MRCVNYLTLMLLTVNILVAGCASNSQQTPEVKKAVVGGQLIYGSIQEPNTLNPLLSDLIATAEVGSLIFSGLVQNNDKGEWIPDLAAEIPGRANGGVSADGLVITYKLRNGVTWHDGNPFTSADVKFTWETIMNRKTNIVSREGYDKIATVETPDANTVVVRFKEYYPAYLNLFSVILPRHILITAEDINKAPFNRAPVGTGPYKFKEWRIAESVIVEANPNYYRGKPNLESIVYKILPDTSIMLSQLKNGDLDIVANISFTMLDQIKGISGSTAVMTPNMIWEHLDFNLDNALFQDVRVRQAIALSIDKQAIIATNLKGAASPANGDQSPLSWAYNPAAKPAARDINAAKTLLTQAGWKQGADGIFAKDGKRLSFSLITTEGNKIREAVARTIAQQLKDAGIEVEVRLIDAQVFFNDVLKNRRFDSAMYAWVAGIEPGNAILWNSRNIPSAKNNYQGQNYSGWRNTEIDSLTDQGQRSSDLEARKQIYYRIQDIIAAEVPVIPLYYRANIDAVRDTVVNYKPNPTPSGNLWNAWEWGLTKKR